MALDFTVKRRGHDFLLNTGITDTVLKESYKKEFDLKGNIAIFATLNK